MKQVSQVWSQRWQVRELSGKKFWEHSQVPREIDIEEDLHEVQVDEEELRQVRQVSKQGEQISGVVLRGNSELSHEHLPSDGIIDESLQVIQSLANGPLHVLQSSSHWSQRYVDSLKYNPGPQTHFPSIIIKLGNKHSRHTDLDSQ